MRVVAVSCGTPRWEQVNGRPVFTSIVRDPLPGALHFGPDGPEGNATAVHTEQVLAFPSEHYDSWTGKFGIARSSWNWCHWGENLTLSGIDENSLHVGDILRIGTNAVFQVTSPRIPCFKLAWRIGQPDQVLRQLMESGWIGFYLRVIAPGAVAADDPISIESPFPESLTVGELARLLSDSEATVTEPLQRALATPALGSQAYGMILHRLSMLTDGKRGRSDRWQGWRAVTVSEITRLSDGIASFRLTAEDGGRLAPYRAGQFLPVRLPAAAESLQRCWSLSDYQEDGADSYRLTVKRTHPGGASDWLHRQAAVGDRLQVRPPSGRFVLERGSFYRAVMISAGIGITPLLAMLKAHAARGAEAPPLLWLHSTRSGASHVLRGETDAIVDANPAFRKIVYYSAPRPDDRLGIDYHHAGRLGAADLVALLAEPQRIAPFGRSIELGGEFSDFYLCGPKPFEQMVRAALLSAGVAAAAIRSESFGAAPGVATSQSEVDSAEIIFRRSAQSGRWSAQSGLSLLEFAESVGLAPEFGCRMGNCHSCEIALLRGDVTYDPPPALAPDPGRVLLCCARPSTAFLELDL